MAGITVLKIEDLRLTEPKLKSNHSDDFVDKQKIFIRKYGQFYIPIVARVAGIWRFVDGLNFAVNYKSLGNDSIICNIISDEDLSFRDFITFRLFYNIKKTKLDHISIAEIISSCFRTKNDFRQLANKVNISEDDIEKYSKLLDFDWDEFSRKPLGVENEQMTFFDMMEDDQIF